MGASPPSPSIVYTRSYAVPSSTLTALQSRVAVVGKQSGGGLRPPPRPKAQVVGA